VRMVLGSSVWLDAHLARGFVGLSDGCSEAPFLDGSLKSLHVEYAERDKEYGILFRLSQFCEYIHLEYVRIHVIYRVNPAEYVIHMLMVASQEYVNIYSTRRLKSLSSGCACATSR